MQLIVVWQSGLSRTPAKGMTPDTCPRVRIPASLLSACRTGAGTLYTCTIKEIAMPTKVDTDDFSNLELLCPNCHAILHYAK